MARGQKGPAEVFFPSKEGHSRFSDRHGGALLLAALLVALVPGVVLLLLVIVKVGLRAVLDQC